MAPGVSFTEKTLRLHNPSLFEVSCELYDMSFKGQGNGLIIFNRSHVASMKKVLQILGIFIILLSSH